MVAVAAITTTAALSAQDRYTLKVPNGLAFSEFKGYQGWQAIAVSHNGDLLAVILGNPAMIDAYKAGIPVNGKQLVPGTLHDIDFMLKDSKRFADGGGWGYGEFEYDTASDSFRLGTQADSPRQANDAECGFACHTIVKNQDYVFTQYPKR